MTKSELHALVWKRFIRMPYGHLLDYADENGDTTIPTPEDCRRNDPNPMGWWTPIENGAFFGGLYLEALIEDYKLTSDPETASCIRTLADGLYLLQDVAHRDGFIARGVATDGTGHYVCSSEDQVFPWVLGLVSYIKCPLCPDPEEGKKRVLKTLRALRAKGFAVPMDTEYKSCDDPLVEHDDWRTVAAVLYSAYAMYEMSGMEEDLRQYRALRDGKPGNSDFTRLEIVSQGYAHDMVRNTHLIQFWIDLSFHLAAGKLSVLDTEKGELYAAGCRSNGVTALRFAEDILKYDNAYGGFDLNWRKISHLSKPFSGDGQEAWNIGVEEHIVWSKSVVPHRHMEHDILANALFALWIVLTSGDRILNTLGQEKLERYLPHVDFRSLTTCYAFVGESLQIYARR